MMLPDPSRAVDAAQHEEQARGERLYRGGCQCGAVHYEARLDLARPPEGTASVWQQPLPPESFRLLIGEESLTGYQFSADRVHHFFCVRCGVRVFSHHLRDGGDLYTVDIRNLHSRRVPVAGWLHVATARTD